MTDADLIRDEQTGTALAWVAPANKEAVDTVLNARVGTGNGRSDWVWLRLANGDLFLAVAPQGHTYDEIQAEPGTAWGDGPARWVQKDSNVHRRLLEEGWRVIGDDGERFYLQPPASSAGASLPEKHEPPHGAPQFIERPSHEASQ